MGVRRYVTKKNEVRYAVNVYNKAQGVTCWVGTYKNAEDAKLAFADADRAARMGELVSARTRIGFSDFVDEYLESLVLALLPETVDEYRRSLNHATARFKNRDLTSVTKRDVESLLVDKVNEGWKPLRVRKLRTHIAQAMNAAVAEEYLDRAPTAGRFRKLPTVEEHAFKPLTADEVRSLIEATPDYWKPAVLTLAACGLRRGELFGLTIDDVDLDAGLLTIRGQLRNGKLSRTKSSAGVRTVPLPGELVKQLRDHIASVPWTEARLVFPTPTGYRVWPGNFYRGVWGACRGSSRHTFRLQDA